VTQDCPPLFDDLKDEKTPVSSYYPPPIDSARSGPIPRSENTISGPRPILPRPKGAPEQIEPSVIVGPGILAEVDTADPLLDTVHMVRRLYARKLELTLVASLGAILAAAVTLWLAQTLARGHTSPFAPADSNRLVAPMLSVSLSPPPVFDQGSIDDRR
jgi:hypothetical protein